MAPTPRQAMAAMTARMTMVTSTSTSVKPAAFRVGDISIPGEDGGQGEEGLAGLVGDTSVEAAEVGVGLGAHHELACVDARALLAFEAGFADGGELPRQ